MLTNSTLSRITADAEAYAKKYNHFKDTTFAGMERQTYVEAASVEAERAQEVITLYQQLVDLQNDELNAMESFTNGYMANRERIVNALDLQSRIKTALTKYNNPK